MSISEYDQELRSQPQVGAGYVYVVEAHLAEGEDGRTKFSTYFVGDEPTLGHIAESIRQKIEYVREMQVEAALRRNLSNMLEAMKLDALTYQDSMNCKRYFYRFANVKIMEISIYRKQATFLK